MLQPRVRKEYVQGPFFGFWQEVDDSNHYLEVPEIDSVPDITGELEGDVLDEDEGSSLTDEFGERLNANSPVEDAATHINRLKGNYP